MPKEALTAAWLRENALWKELACVVRRDAPRYAELVEPPLRHAHLLPFLVALAMWLRAEPRPSARRDRVPAALAAEGSHDKGVFHA